MESIIAIPKQSDGNVSTYRERLVKARVNTEEDISKMSDDQVKKIYLKHEQGIVDGVGDQVCKFFAKGWVKAIARFAPLTNEEEFEKTIGNDVFVKAAIKNYFPSIYYDWGGYLAPLSILATTVTSIDYGTINVRSKDNQEPEEDESCNNSGGGSETTQ